VNSQRTCALSTGNHPISTSSPSSIAPVTNLSGILEQDKKTSKQSGRKHHHWVSIVAAA
jgi:hypothetical protein